MASDEDFWAWETVQAALDGPDPLPVLDAVLAADQADPCYLGAGPVEDLLASDPERWDGSVAERCRRDRKWREAVACVWLDDNIRSRLVELRSYLPINR